MAKKKGAAASSSSSAAAAAPAPAYAASDAVQTATDGEAAAAFSLLAVPGLFASLLPLAAAGVAATEEAEAEEAAAGGYPVLHVPLDEMAALLSPSSREYVAARIAEGATPGQALSALADIRAGMEEAEAEEEEAEEEAEEEDEEGESIEEIVHRLQQVEREPAVQAEAAPTFGSAVRRFFASEAHALSDQAYAAGDKAAAALARGSSRVRGAARRRDVRHEAALLGATIINWVVWCAGGAGRPR